MVCIVGAVRTVKGLRGTSVKFVLDDNTGLLESAYYGDDSNVSNSIQLNQYVRVYGRYITGQPLKVHHAMKLASFNEITHHYLIVAHVYNHFQTKKINAKDINQVSEEVRQQANTQNSNEQIKQLPKENLMEDLDNTYTQVVRKILEECDDSEQGLSVDEIIQKFNKLHPDQQGNPNVASLLEDCIALMNNAGLIYTTVDDSHFVLS